MAAQAPVCDFGWKAPSFTLRATDGRTHSLSDLKGEHGTVIIEGSRWADNVEKTTYADVSDEASVGRALEGCDAAVNAVGLYVERGDETFRAIHELGAMHVARQSYLSVQGAHRTSAPGNRPVSPAHTAAPFCLGSHGAAADAAADAHANNRCGDAKKRDNVVGEGALTFADLGLEPTAIEVVLPVILRSRA